MTQALRILEKLESNSEGVYNYEFFRMSPPILRAAARVRELRKLGHNIKTIQIKKGVFKYRLEEM